MDTLQDTVFRFTSGDRIIVVDGGEWDKHRGTIKSVRVLYESTVYRVTLDNHVEVLTFADWQLEAIWDAAAVRRVA